MTKPSHFKIRPLYQALALIALVQPVYASQNFLIQPNGPLPTSVTTGGSVTANYTVTNLTNSARNGYNVVGLPNTVTQNASGGNCPAPINLVAHASCNLQLIISGPVKSNFALCHGTSCTTATTPLNVTLSSFSRMVAGGTYCSNSGCLPLLAQTSSGTWSYPTSILTNLPSSPGFSNANIRSASCSGELCIVAGYDNASSTTPFIAVSTSNANNWVYPVGGDGTWPIDLTGNAQFTSASCSGTLCIVVGQYFGIGGFQQFPVIAQSTNSGTTWTYPIDSTTPPPNLFINSRLNGASCSGNLCIAAGTYEDNTNANFYALLEQTTNGGSSWSNAIDRFNGPTLSNYGSFGAYAEFFSASCSGLVCAAAGQYNNNITNIPMVAVTQDGGSSWNYAIDDTHTAKPSLFSINGGFTSTSCSGNLCIAGGTYIDTNAHQQAMLARSTDGGITWTYVIDATTGPSLSNYLSSAAFYSVSCSGTVCAAGGVYTNTNSTPVPMLAQSTDSGATWTYVIDSNNAPSHLTDFGQFNSVSCASNTCIAAGTFMVCGIQFPLLAQSIDGGSWTYAISDNAATIPSNLTGSGVFNGSSVGSTSSLMPLTFKSQYKGCAKVFNTNDKS